MSIISQIFDPLDIISPVIIKLKIILQHLWKLKFERDELQNIIQNLLIFSQEFLNVRANRKRQKCTSIFPAKQAHSRLACMDCKFKLTNIYTFTITRVDISYGTFNLAEVSHATSIAPQRNFWTGRSKSSILVSRLDLEYYSF